MNNAPQSPSSSSARVEHARLQQLEQKYTALDAQIAESPVKQALSILHALVHEVRREAGTSPGGVGRQGLTIRDIAELYRTAPAMEGPAQNAGLAVGTEAPDFALPDAEGKTVRLSDYRGKPVVLVFYPLDWSPGCSQQLDLYQHDLGEFTQRGAVLLRDLGRQHLQPRRLGGRPRHHLPAPGRLPPQGRGGSIVSPVPRQGRLLGARVVRRGCRRRDPLQPHLAVPESRAGHPRVARCARPGGVALTGTSGGVTEADTCSARRLTITRRRRERSRPQRRPWWCTARRGARR